ncbi:MAG: choice-of-anchor Q domain-containing protein [Planctomycetota bacterium]|jgi:hypothetical protein
MEAYHGTVTATNCLFTANAASSGGGAVYHHGAATTLTNCTIIGNSAVVHGGAMRVRGSPEFSNCILRGNSPDELYISSGSPLVTYSNVSGGWPGEGNIDQDPLFVDADGPDDVPGTVDDDLRLGSGSPCINTGDNDAPDLPDLDFEGDARVQYCRVDMGADETPFLVRDCNSNGLADACDIVNGTSLDANGNDIADDCEAVIHVDDNAVGHNDGLNWSTAFNDLQSALAFAGGAQGVVEEIWVTGGTYTPAAPGGDRSLSFTLPHGASVYGGFAGWETERQQRDSRINVTTLSGDLNGDDGPGFANNDENSHSVVTATGTNVTALLDGFVITGGHAEAAGAGLLIVNADLTLTNCAVVANWANGWGGGIYDKGTVALVNCIVSGNWAGGNGGGLFSLQQSPSLANCLFSGNSSQGNGGAIGTFLSGPTLTNCTLSSNSAQGFGGGIYNFLSGAALTNSILWNNSDQRGTDELAQVHWPVPVVDYSCIQGWTGTWGGIGNTGDNPLFLDAHGPDGIVGSLDDDLRLLPGSPCIDAGDNTAVPLDITDLDANGDISERLPLDLAGDPRFVDDPATDDTGVPDASGYLTLVDMGAYEYQGARLDIKPGSCPNPLNRKSRGVLPVGLVGTSYFDVTAVDLASILLTRADGIGGSVAPNEGPPGPHSVFADVATPFEGELCNCHEEEGDSITDLSMKFWTQEVVEVLELNNLPRGATVELIVTGALLDGTPFEASDCVTLVPAGRIMTESAGTAAPTNRRPEPASTPSGSEKTETPTPSRAPGEVAPAPAPGSAGLGLGNDEPTEGLPPGE